MTEASSLPMTIKQLKERLEFALQNGASEDDHVFYMPIGEDEGNSDALIPIETISTPTIHFFHSERDRLAELIKREGVVMAFVSPKVRDKRFG
jgi:hypothetical protein